MRAGAKSAPNIARPKEKMKKNFKLDLPNKNRDRALDSIKHEVRTYLRRERNKKLPEGVDFWDFDCRFGVEEDEAVVVPVSMITSCMDQAFAANAAGFYVEILAKHGFKPGKSDED